MTITIEDDQNVTLDKTAFVFPGQGSQKAGMGRAFYDAWRETRTVFDDLNAALEVDLYELCFRGSSAELQRPRNTQPVMLAVGSATFAGIVSRFEVEPAFVAGHSLGHFTALAAAGMASPTDLVGVVRERGKCMERAEQVDGPGTMVAVLLADPAVVADACADRTDVGVALYNASRQTVISGTVEGVDAVQEELEKYTRARFRELDVGAAFHSPVMASAVDCVQEALEGVTMREAASPIVSDVSGTVYTDPDVAFSDLTTQITSPIDWVGVVEELKRRGVERYVEFPPAGVLSDLIERIHPNAECLALETPADANGAFT